MARRIVTEISVAALEQAFSLAEENLEQDLSVIRISMIRDVHDDSIELYVTFFGQASDEEDAPVAEFWVDPDVVGTEIELKNGGIEAYRLRAIFSNEVWNLIVGLCTPVQWLDDDGYFTTISLFRGEANGIKLLPVDQ